jgi:hypothetical protein
MIEKNELEMGIIAARKALERLIEANPKSGVIVDRGASSESKIRNSEALKTLDRVLALFRDRGTRNWGVCLDCKSFSQSGMSSVADAFGRCTETLSGKKTVHCYDSCPRHSEGGSKCV